MQIYAPKNPKIILYVATVVKITTITSILLLLTILTTLLVLLTVNIAINSIAEKGRSFGLQALEFSQGFKLRAQDLGMGGLGLRV